MTKARKLAVLAARQRQHLQNSVGASGSFGQSVSPPARTLGESAADPFEASTDGQPLAFEVVESALRHPN
jgi:hypothetical protein